MAKEGFTNGYALIIGVGDDLPATIKDAQKVHETIIDPERASYPSDQVQLLLEKEATNENVLTAIQSLKEKILLDNNAKATVLVYYSGHGGLDRNAPDTPFYFLSNGYDTNDYQGTCLEGQVFSQKLSQLPAQKLIILLDCCYAGQLKTKAGREDEEDVPRSFGLQPDNQKMVNILDQGAGRVIIASSTADQVSYIGKEGLSLFTEVLVEALSGKNTPKAEAHVSFADVWGHIGKEVSKRAQALYQEPQDPVINAQDVTFFDFCQNPMEEVVEVPKVFILNDPADNRFLEELDKQLAGMARRGKISKWNTNQIVAGSSISGTLERELQEAQIIVLLVSADYLASDRCYDIQEKAINLGKRILPVIIRHCLYEDDDFIHEHAKLPQQNGVLTPVAAWENQDSALAQIAGHIRSVAKDLKA